MSHNRRDFLKNLGLATTGLMAAPTVMAAEKSSKKKPNLLILHGDEWNFRYLSCYGATFINTPNIDRLAKRGSLCTNFYANHPVCTPSRGSMMTGRYPHVNGAINNNQHLKHDEVTFAEMCRRAGYKTGYSGKWHLDGGGKPGWAPKNKFGWEDNRYMYNRGHWKKLEDTPNGPRVGQKGGKNSYGVIGDEKTFTTDWLANKTIDFIKEHKAKPFCYMCSIPDPHGPNTVRAPYNTMYSETDFGTPVASTSPADQRPAWARIRGHHGPENRARYAGMIKCIDDNIGKILKCLEDEGLLENTIIVVTADHGDLMGEHGLNNKGIAYDASAKVPFVISWPGHISEGKTVSEVMSMVDFGPTMLGLLGIDKSGREQGHDASSVFTGKSTGWKDNAILMSHGSKGSWLGIATQRYKLVYDSADEPWLFDNQRDSKEEVNYFASPEYTGTIKDLSARLITYCNETEEPILEDAGLMKGLHAGLEGKNTAYTGKKAKVQVKGVDSYEQKENPELFKKKKKKAKKRNKKKNTAI